MIEWAERAARHLKAELKRANVTYEELADGSKCMVLLKPKLIDSLSRSGSCTPTRNDGCFMNRVGGCNIQRDDRVPALVIGGQHFLLFSHDHRAPLRAHR